MSAICSRRVEDAKFRDGAPMRTSAKAFKVEIGEALFKGCGATKTGTTVD